LTISRSARPLLALESDKKALHTFVKSYFASRNEDGAPQ